MTEDEARTWLERRVSRETIARLEVFVALLRDEMARQNLISPASAEHVWARHVVDSAQLLELDRSDAEGPWVDIGSGAGFPGVVAAIAGRRPVVLIERRPLRTAFLERVVSELALDAAVITGKAQDAQAEPKSPFVPSEVEKRLAAEPGASRLRSKQTALGEGAAVLSARAVAPATKLFAWAHHLSRPDTIWLLPKGKSAASELAEAKRTWQGRFHVKQSVTDPQAGIIVARDVRRRRA